MQVHSVLFIFAVGIAGNYNSLSASANTDSRVPVDFHHPQLDPFPSSVIPDQETVKLYSDSPVPIDFHDPQLVHFVSNVAPNQESSEFTRNLMTQVVTAVKALDPTSIRQVFECSLCREHFNVDTLATLECDHTFHKACYMGYSEVFQDGIQCPLCRKIVPHQPRNGPSFLLETLRLFEAKGYIRPLERLYDDSPSGIDFRDVQLVKFVSSANTDGMKPGVAETTISDMKSAVERHDKDLLRDLLQCPICYDHFNSGLMVTLECDHTMHKTCLVEYFKNGIKSTCPICRQPFQDIPPVSKTFLSETIRILEAKRYIMPQELMFPDSLHPISCRNDKLVNLISSANLEQATSDSSKAVMLKTVSAVKQCSLDGLRKIVMCPICSKPYTAKTLVTLNCHHSMHESCYMRHRLTKTSCPICQSLGPHVPLIRPSFLRNVVELLEGERYIRPSEVADVPKTIPRVYVPNLENNPYLEYKLFIAVKTKLPASIRALIRCPICTESMGATTVVRLDCGHCFHNQCVSGFTCPICKMIDDGELERDSYLLAGNEKHLQLALRQAVNLI